LHFIHDSRNTPHSRQPLPEPNAILDDLILFMKGFSILSADHIPTTGALLIPTHLNDAEFAALREACHRPVRRLEAADVAAGKLDDAGAAITAGELVVFVPAPGVAWSGSLHEIPRERIETLLAQAWPVVPLAVHRPADTALALERTRKMPSAILSFARTLDGGEHTVAGLQEAWLLADEAAFSSRPFLRGNLGRAVIRGLKRHSSTLVHDGMDDSVMSFGHILAAALALAQQLKQETTKSRVAIVLPPGRAGLIANAAVLLAGKVPVNLNFTAGKNAVESAIRQAEVDRFLTVDLFVRKMQNFPWPPAKQLTLIERVLPSLKKKAILWGALSKALPASWISTLLGLPRHGGDAEATLLFTSGSSGEPKGVVLSHRNLLANVTQFGGRLGLHSGEKILGSLPLFHSLGCTVTLWYPLIEGLGIVTYPSPMEVGRLAQLIQQHGIALLLSTPTFLRGFLRKATREQLASLKLAVTGAEKLPPTVAQSFKDAFGHDVMEGYGLTETSPGTNVNLPTLQATTERPYVVPSHRPGSVGQILPGMAVKITDSSNNEPLPLNQSGIIWFKGANVFPGYLKQPRRTEEVLVDGWFRTGDVGRVDEDGFLYIEGRLSRFSKIAGEMVPHETVEDHIIRALGLEGESERKIAVVGVPDPDKGEALVLLSTIASETIKQEQIQLRYALLDRGVPSLWIPKRIVAVQEIPLLASGKMDLKKCEDLAKAGT
jgi:acyl-[acyl-carrier-protein]-phospholipid O-acyltransferase / long-chain-fatty-acid--[acyl-carrier-protein] ligase